MWGTTYITGSYLVNAIAVVSHLQVIRDRVNQMHRPHRRPVGVSGTAISSKAADRSARTTVAKQGCGVERCFVGFAHGCSLARSGASLSALSKLSSSFSTVAALRAAHAVAEVTGRGLTRPRQTRSERIVHRCQFQFGERRGSAVGPTRRGKGSKIMAISDGHGLPLAVHVASASPHETKLVRPMLEQRFVAEAPERMIGNRAYDSDPLDVPICGRFGVQSVALHKSTRSKAPRKRVAHCVVIGAAGKSSACSRSFIIIVVSSFAGNLTQRISSEWRSLLVP
jgi:hypothetical protein